MTTNDFLLSLLNHDVDYDTFIYALSLILFLKKVKEVNELPSTIIDSIERLEKGERE